MSVQPARKLFTTDEYHQMITAGVFDEDDRIELIEGELYEMSPIGPRHAAAVNRLARILQIQIAASAIVSVQNPIELSSFSEPQPDLTVLKWRDDFYSQSHPSPSDVLIAIEVSDTTQDRDRGFKIPVYARAGLGEAWLVDLFNDCIEIYSAPANGKYQDKKIIRRGHPVVSQAAPQLQLSADDILG